MIVAFDPVARSVEVVRETVPADATPWLQVEGLLVRLWSPNFNQPGAPWLLGRIALAGVAWVIIPDGLGHDAGLDSVARMVRLPAPEDEAAAVEMARPPAVPADMQGAERLARELSRRAAIVAGIASRARPLDIWKPFALVRGAS